MFPSAGWESEETHLNPLSVAMFRNTPPEIAGTIGAIFNSALQLGSAVGLSIITTIQVSVDNKAPKPGHTKNPYAGRAAAFWFLLAVMAIEALAVLFLYRKTALIPQDLEAAKKEAGTDTVDEPEAEKIEATGTNDTATPGAPLSRSDTVVEKHSAGAETSAEEKAT